MRLLSSLLASSLGLLAAAPGHAQQPLEDFLAAADTHSTDLREVRELARSLDGAAAEARGRLLPSASASGTYTRNEREVVVNLGPDRMAVLSPFDQLDARFTLTMPLLDVAAWEGLFAAEALADAADARTELAEDTVRLTIVQTWHGLVGARAVLDAANAAVLAAEHARSAAAARVEVGVAPAAELARAEAELARAQQARAEAQLAARLAAQTLTVITGLTPDDRRVELADDLAAEPAVDTFLAGIDALPAVAAASHDVRAAERARDGAWAALLPTIGGSLTERLTNAAGFGPNSVWALSVSATWTLDLVRPFAIETREGSLAAARTRAEEARLVAEAAIIEAWERVASLRERAAAAEAALAASARAELDARARFEAGAGTQIEAILSERDRFSAEVGRIQALAELRVARAALRTRAGLPLD
jgi:outer membrane protein TolC